MREDLVAGELAARALLALADLGQERFGVGPARQLVELGAQVLLELAAGLGRARRQLVACLVGDVPDRDRSGHAASLLLMAALCKRVLLVCC